MAGKTLSPDRKKLLMAAGAAVLLVVLYMRARNGATTATSTDPAATDPFATGSLGGDTGAGGSTDSGTGASAGPDPTTLGLLNTVATTEAGNAAALQQIGAGIAAILAAGDTSGSGSGSGSGDGSGSGSGSGDSTGDGGSTGDGDGAGDTTKPPRKIGPPVKFKPPAGVKVTKTQTLKSGAKLYTTATGAKIEQAPGKTPYRVSKPPVPAPKGTHVKPAAKHKPLANAYSSGRKARG